MISSSSPVAAAVRTWEVLRPIWWGGLQMAIGATIKATRAEVAELITANKLGPAPDAPAVVADAPVEAPPAAKRSRRASAEG